MKHKYYLPPSDEGKAAWLNTFKDALAPYATLFGITPAQMDQLAADALYFSFLLNLINLFKDYSKTLFSYKDIIRDGGLNNLSDVPAPPSIGAHTATGAGIFERVQLLVRQIKSNSNYTETIGENLGIIGEEITINYDTAKPNPKGVLKNGHAYLKWDQMHADGANIRADYNGGTNYQFVGHVASGHFFDAHLPESGAAKKFAYIVRLTMGPDQLEVGEWSDPVFVTLTGPSLIP